MNKLRLVLTGAAIALCLTIPAHAEKKADKYRSYSGGNVEYYSSQKAGGNIGHYKSKKNQEKINDKRGDYEGKTRGRGKADRRMRGFECHY